MGSGAIGYAKVMRLNKDRLVSKTTRNVRVGGRIYRISSTEIQIVGPVDASEHMLSFGPSFRRAE
jgi:hypothetical protein